jgi:hypothetical protein
MIAARPLGEAQNSAYRLAWILKNLLTGGFFNI